jgi:arabinogalactan endo-1,4-beta-galactosidase
MEASGYKFYDKTGVQEDCFQLMKNIGFNSIRLRAWVNPADGWCNTKDVVAKALRAKALGLKVMLDFHYSDTWADPSDQTKPAAWQSLSFDSLTKTVYNYTYHVMDTLNTCGVTVTWAQTGNETNNGMLWPDGQASTNMSNFAQLITSGYNAIKAASPATQVIVHISNGYDTSLFKWIFDGLQSNNAKWDIIGMSLYPSYYPTTLTWQQYDSLCLINMKNVVARYNKDVMICEVGMPMADSATCKAFLTDIIQKVQSVPDGRGLGVFYWEPEAYNWQGYGLGAFNINGEPTEALDAFSNSYAD